MLSRMYDYYASIHSDRVLIDVLVSQAMVNAALGKTQQALEKLTEAIVLAEPSRFIRPFLDQGSEMMDLLSRMVKQNPKMAYAGHIIEAFISMKPGFSSNGTDDHNWSRSSVQGDPLTEPLTNREIEVLRMLNMVTSNKDTAQRLFISPETVKRHLSTIYHKLEVKNRQQALIRAKAIGIL